MLYLFLVGFTSLLAQVVLLRELAVAFYGIDLLYVLALGVWLLCSGIGSLAARRCSGSPAATQAGFAALWLLTPAGVVFLRGVRTLFGGVPGAYLPFDGQLLGMIAAVAPTAILLGYLFVNTARRYMASGYTLARAYGFESAGGVAGGLAATLLLQAGMPNLAIGFICSLAALSALLPQFQERRAIGSAAVAVVAVLTLAGIVHASKLDRISASWNHSGLLETRDSPYGRITITEHEDQFSIFENDVLTFTSQTTDAEEFAHLAALQHPAPKHILALGGAVDGTVAELLAHVPDRIDCVELNPVLLQLGERLLPSVRETLTARPVHVRVGDPRAWVESARSRYDLILVAMPEPLSGETNRFYTVDFFRSCRSALLPGGILAFRLSSAENFWTPQLRQKTASIHRALQRVFADIVVLPGSRNIITASQAPLTRDPAVLSARLESRRIRPRLVSGRYIRYVFANDRFATVRDLLENEPVAANTDIQPICYRYALLVWLSRFFPETVFVERLPGSWSAALLIALAAAAAWALRSRSRSRIGLAFVAGLSGMALETVLILFYQVKNGVLFQEIGILLMSFMAGLTLGPGLYQSSRSRLRSQNVGLVWIAAFALAGALISWNMQTGAVTGLAGSAVQLCASGVLVAALFCHSAAGPRSQETSAAPLYSADLLGGCVGSVAGSLFLVPVYGLQVVVFCVIGLLAASVPLALKSRARG